MKRILFLVMGLAISIVALYYAFRDFDFGKVWVAIGNVQAGFLLLVIVPYILTFMTKVWRWRLLFHPDEDKVRTIDLFGSLMISYIPLPFRLGEVARAVVLNVRSGMPVARIFSTIFVEKVLDVLTLLVLLGISLPFVGLDPQLQGSAYLFSGAFLALAVVMLGLVLRPDLARKLVHVVAVRIPGGLGSRIEEIAEHVLQGLAPLSNPRIVGKLGLWSLATWGINAVTVYLLLQAFNLPQVSPMAAVMLIVMTNLGMAIPSAPGYVGTFELVVVLVLGAIGVSRSDAQTFALIYHVIGLVPVALIGVVAAIQQGIGLTAFRSGDQPPEPGGDSDKTGTANTDTTAPTGTLEAAPDEVSDDIPSDTPPAPEPVPASAHSMTQQPGPEPAITRAARDDP